MGLKAMGLEKRAVSQLLKISRNTLRKYWEPGEEEVSTESGASYRAPWSDRIDWEAVKKKLGQGQTLLHYWEEFREVLSPEDPVQQVSYVSFWREFRGRYPESPIQIGKDFKPGSCVDVNGSKNSSLLGKRNFPPLVVKQPRFSSPTGCVTKVRLFSFPSVGNFLP